MLSRIVVGTLSTLNTMMTPLAGDAGSKALSFKLEAPIERRAACPSLGRNPLTLHIKPAPESRLSIEVSGRICAEGKKTKPVSIAVTLPEDLFDSLFIESLPVDTPYIVSESAFGIASSTGKTRFKLTKRKMVNDLIPLRIEWVPPIADEKPLYEPLTIWFRKLPPSSVGTTDFAWERIEISELNRLSDNSFAIVEDRPQETVR